MKVFNTQIKINIMKKILTLILFVLATSFSQATHLMGGQISASYLSTDTSGSHYFLELDVYRDTLGIPMSLNHNIEVYQLDPLTGNYNLLFTDSMTFVVGGPMSTMSSVYGVEIYHFTDTITFPNNGFYMIKWSHCCRNGAIINMSNPLSESMSFLTYVDVDSSNPNSTPTYLAPPVIYLPTNTLWQYNPLPFDPDGDSLVWNISVPLSLNDTVSGYEYLSDTSYSNSTGIFSMDSVTGEITWNAKMIGNFVVSFAIEEYRNGALVGAMSRDMQFVVIPDTNAMPDITYAQNPPTNNMGYPYVKILPGQNYNLKILASDSDQNDQVSIEAYGESFSLNTAASTFSTTATGNGNEIEGTFSWSPSINQVREKPYLVVFRTSDNYFYYDETLQVEVSLATEKEDLNLITSQNIYPNPASNSFTLPINIQNDQNLVLSIYNVLGVKVGSDKLDLRSGNHLLFKSIDLENGKYFVTISDEKGKNIIQQRLLIIK